MKNIPHYSFKKKKHLYSIYLKLTMEGDESISVQMVNRKQLQIKKK